MTKIWLAVALASLLVACDQPPGDTVAAGRGQDGDIAPITCSTFYRSAVTQPLEDGPVLSFAEPARSQTTRFEELVFNVDHANDEIDGRSLNVSVSEAGRKHPLVSQLFQMERNAAPANIFGTTGQGFTGLLYAYSAAGAELQFFCESG